MTRPQAGPATTTAQQLLLTAERLFAEHGLGGVSLRQIAVEAGSANNSAVAYHFGSKEGLVEAIFAYRLPQLLQRRELLRARVAPGDLRSRLEAHLLPVYEIAESREGAYLSFLEQLGRDASSQPLLANPEAERSQALFLADVHPLLPDVDPWLRHLRIQQVQLLSLHTAAERERALAAGQSGLLPFALFVSTSLDAWVGYLTAPVSAETQRFAGDAPTALRTRRRR